MPDNTNETGKPDREKININEAYEIQDWSKKLGVTAEELTNAVKAVGTRAQDVEAYIKNRGGKQ